LASEYGWTIDYILELPRKRIEAMIKAIEKRYQEQRKALTRGKNEKRIEVGKSPNAEFLMTSLGILREGKKNG